MFETQTRIIQMELFMTNSDRYSPDDYNADQIDEDAVEQQGTVKANLRMMH